MHVSIASHPSYAYTHTVFESNFEYTMSSSEEKF
jgi:hypothetical protein